MRQIKFRAKTVNEGEWVYGMTISRGTIDRKRNRLFFEVAENKWKGVIPDTLGQFTGLTDCNGKEIFEGDIVRYYDDIEDEQVTSHVIYHKESCSFCVAPTELCGDYIGLTVYWQFEVIGNIYDNPELINQPTEV